MRHELIPFDFFDRIFRDFDKTLNGFPWHNWDLNFYDTNFPPADIHISDDRTWTGRFIVAGYPEDKINLDFDGEYMVLQLKSASDCCEEDGKYVCKCIKRSSSTTRYYLPGDKYERENAKAELKDGVLKVIVPAKEKETVKININKG
jgi:molecular chaperone IbpB/HSP20 family protein